MAESINTVGLLSPITVYSPNDQTLDLVAGAHRLAAAIELGWETIDAIVLTGDALHAQLAEIDENLCRSGLTPVQEAEHIARRKEIWEAMQVADQVGKVFPPEIGYKKPPTQTKGFAEETAALTGETKRNVNLNVRRGTEVCQEARDLIRGTVLDKCTFLDRLAKGGTSPKEQVDTVLEALAAHADREKAQALRSEAHAREEAAQQVTQVTSPVEKTVQFQYPYRRPYTVRWQKNSHRARWLESLLRKAFKLVGGTGIEPATTAV